jgi:hypothetical protein
MCFFGGGGGGGQPQVIYRDAPSVSPTPVSTLPAPMNTLPVGPADSAGVVTDSTKNSLGTSIFKINKDPIISNDYVDQGIDNGIQYLG